MTSSSTVEFLPTLRPLAVRHVIKAVQASGFLDIGTKAMFKVTLIQVRVEIIFAFL